MKKIIIKIAIIAVAVIALVFAFSKIHSLKEENTRLKSNQDILLTEKEFVMSENQKYKVSDSLNAVRVSELELTLKEYKRYRSEDLKLIEQLKAGKSDLQKIITSQYETISTLSAKLQDSIRIDTATNQVDTLKCFDYKSKWTDVKGCVDLRRDTVELQINNRESLKVVETVTYKRFLGFLWKTNKVKSRQVDVVSENPNTEIMNCEYISIKQ
jgi:uncharacterized protein YxeA